MLILLSNTKMKKKQMRQLARITKRRLNVIETLRFLLSTITTIILEYAFVDVAIENVSERVHGCVVSMNEWIRAQGKKVNDTTKR